MRDDYTFKLEGKTPVAISHLDLTKYISDAEMRRVAFDDIGPFNISTVFLFINHAHGGGDPVLFETMVFQNGTEVCEENFDLVDRYCTWDEAIDGHKSICNQVRRLYRSATGSGSE